MIVYVLTFHSKDNITFGMLGAFSSKKKGCSAISSWLDKDEEIEEEEDRDDDKVFYTNKGIYILESVRVN